MSSTGEVRLLLVGAKLITRQTCLNPSMLVQDIMRKVPTSNLGLSTCKPDRHFRCYSQSSNAHAEIVQFFLNIYELIYYRLCIPFRDVQKILCLLNNAFQELQNQSITI
jgi:hypothetical protein